ncbi:hypothetical protein O6H91_06G021300 [Diphasiastrum complanatum]|uniref:Uncharacterized protein n=7 Tax=Diphasiastrum complanatum TaxID=34168 RepID=A0ACC2DB99_DIPCM|nr:hypothetical protein O6H91_06G021300 [Diphasiastrum complanatum]KAJ7551588.1 hypothetical protein O6H91_06G021300 [Diphasiastrum complanatum]KAJ7551589.1 hypothetical protein O6H91_06G021300 [Diphasiastrum complanatum]KAJ7551590.1 hypothetical protein O6H91_06G021300 [Diphasiastrum complanatum]KAJ7551591.1 hypothetical protein O6H91_06G021300 [Diphasiastrum complanatum]
MADNSNNSNNNSGDDTNERPQDWEMLTLSLSSLADPKPSADANLSDADVDAVPSSTGSGKEEHEGISDDQVHSKYFGLASSSLSENSKNEKSALFTSEGGKTDTSVVGKGTASGVVGSAVSSEVDWMEPSPLLASTVGSGEEEPSGAVSTDLESSTAKNENQRQSSISSKALTGYPSTVGPVPTVEGTDTVPELYSCFDNEEAECLAGIEREILAEPDYAFSETFDEAYSELRAADVDTAGKPLLETSSKSKTKKAWWKQQVEVLGVHVSQASALWSLALAATVMGLVILGQRWHHERSQNQQLRLQLGSKDEKINQLIFQISRLKDAVSGRRRVPVMRS